MFKARTINSLRSFSRRIILPRLEYPVERPFPWPWLSYAALVFVLLVVGFLVPMNYALQGYQVITTFERDPNTTSRLWFNRFTGHPEPGSQCDDHIFEVGDSIRTNTGLFSYTLQDVAHANENDLESFGATTVPYKGQSLGWCDVTSLRLQIGPQYGVLNIDAKVRCAHPDFQINMTTTYGAMIGTPDPRTADGTVLPYSSPLHFFGIATNELFFQYVSTPAANGTLQLYNVPATFFTSYPERNVFCPMAIVSNRTAVISIVGDSPYYTCPAEKVTSPPINASFIDTSSLLNYNPYNISNILAYQNSINNLFEVMVSVVRFDLGNLLPNNFLYNPKDILAANQTFLPTFLNIFDSAYDSLLEDEFGPAMVNGILPYTIPNQFYPSLGQTPFIVASYVCHLTVPKSAGSAVVSVIVATLSIGSTIWGLFIFSATYFVKREPNANYCEYHNLEAGAFAPLPVQSDDSDKEKCGPIKPDAISVLPASNTFETTDEPPIPSNHPTSIAEEAAPDRNQVS